LNYHTYSEEFILNIEQTNLGLKGIIDFPEQSVYGISLDTIWIEKGCITFHKRSANVIYFGLVNESCSEIKGIYTRDGQSEQLVFTRSEIEIPNNSLKYIQKHYRKQEVYIPMRDGVKLFTSIYTPRDSEETHPILMVRTPYNVEPSAEGFHFLLVDMGSYVKDRYIFVFQDVRGRYMSEGTFIDVRPIISDKTSDKDIDESTDTFDTIEWLVKNVSGNNSNVGISGTSYPGFYASMSLPGSHPSLKAVSPQAPVTDYFMGDDWHHNGAFFVLDAFRFLYSFGRPRPELTRKSNPQFRWPVDDSYEFFMRLGPIKNIVKDYFGDTIEFWNQIVRHPNYDDFWKARTPLPHLINIKPAVMTVGGWFDAENLFGALKTYKAIEKQNTPGTSNRLVMGPWFHGQWNYGKAENLGNVYWDSDANEYYREIEYKFFSHYLMGKGDMDLPEATIYNTGTKKWMAFNSWPPSQTKIRQLYFHREGRLSFDIPGTKDDFDEYISDPMKPVPYQEDVHLRRTKQYMTDDQRFASRRPDVLVYSTEMLTEDITFTGPLFAHLYVSTTGTDADFIVKLIDVFPDLMPNYPVNSKKVPMGGYQQMVRGEVMRGKYRNSFEDPEPFEPGETTQVRFELQDIAHTFKKGRNCLPGYATQQ
jgi:putative CocE/NonD family hydrolase